MSTHAPARVRALPEQLANQIAAGEVVERPASVVKELVENSVDAGAGAISVDVEAGGVRLVRVRDDGAGIHHDDLLLALGRHATSKIRSLDELERVRSMGFRGEALPSIASVSRLTLTSRTAGDDRAWTVVARGREEAAPPVPAAHPPGTTVEVRDLFYNTPARRKFLRTEKTEFRHIEEVVRRVALGRPGVALSLRHHDRQVLRLRPAGSEDAFRARLATVCGRQFVDQALEVGFEGSEMRLEGWVSPPGGARASADLQYVFVNGRMVRDSLVSHALRQAYQDALPEGRFAAYVLYFEIDPGAVDVNVHPTKHEVRFREARLVHDFLFRGVQRALGDTAPLMDESRSGRGSGGPPFTSHAPRPQGGGSVRDQVSAYAALHPPPAAPRSSIGRLGRPLGTTCGRYLVAESADGLVLVDAAAARRVVAGARLRAAVEAGQPQPVPLLLPTEGTASREAEQALAARGHRLDGWGFDLRAVAPGRISLRAVPAALAEAEPASVLAALLESVCRLGDDEEPGAQGAHLDTLVEALRFSGEAPRGAEAEVLLQDLGETGAAPAGIYTVLGRSDLAGLLGEGGRRPKP